MANQLSGRFDFVHHPSARAKHCLRPLIAVAFIGFAHGVSASSLDEQIQIFSALAGITQNALQDMEARKIPLEKTQIFQEVGHDPDIARSLRDAVSVRRQGVSISEITDAWAQGCLNALSGSAAAPAPRRASPIR